MTRLTSLLPSWAGGAVGVGLLLCITACGGGGEEVESMDTDTSDEAADSAEQDPQDTSETEPEGDSAVQLEAVTVQVPQDWSLQETPADYDPNTWAAGAFDDDESPTEFIRVMPAMEESTAADVGGSRLVAEGEIAQAYGENFETLSRDAGEIRGAEDVHVIDFRYFEDEVEILGRWWVLADQESGVMSAVEHAGRADAEPDFDATAEAISFNPGQGG